MLLDGGVQVSMFINEKFVCKSDAVYGVKGGSGEAGEGMAGHSHGGAAGGGMAAAPAPAAGAAKPDPSSGIKTISSMTTCNGPFPVKKGDTLKLVAEYNLAEHPLRDTGNGKGAADVMGMMGISFSPNK